MYQFLTLYTITLVAIVCYVARSIIIRIFYNRKAKQLGCLSPATRSSRWPWGLDTTYSIFQAYKAQRLPDWLLDSYHYVGKSTWQQNDLGKTNIYTCDPKNVQAILATQFRDFELGSTRRSSFFPLLGNGIFTADGEKWTHARSMLRPQFSRHQVADLFLEELHVQNLLQQLSVRSGQNWTAVIDVVPLFFRLTLDSATEFLFGQSVNSQTTAFAGNDDSFQRNADLDWTSFGSAFDAAIGDVATRSWLYDLYWLYNPRSFKNHCQDVHKYADYYVDLALRSPKEPQNRKEHQAEKYVFLHELAQQTQDPIELRSQLLNILVAGRDTTAGLLGWTFYLLGRHPHVFQTLRQSVIDAFGHNSESITFESLKQCTYLQHTLSESLRLFPTVPANSRRAVRDTTLPRGGGPDGTSPVFIKKDQEVNYSVHIMHHREDLWGADVEEFKPERWSGRKPGWEFLPFNGGPRICLGQQFALTEAGYVIVRLLQAFDGLELVEPLSEPRHQYNLTTSPARLMVRFHADTSSALPEK